MVVYLWLYVTDCGFGFCGYASMMRAKRFWVLFSVALNPCLGHQGSKMFFYKSMVVVCMYISIFRVHRLMMGLVSKVRCLWL
jgi:hypothetical protein